MTLSSKNKISESLADTPCTSRCANLSDSSNEQCLACGRTRTEINKWSTFSEVEKKEIVMRCWEKFMPRQKMEGLIREREEITKKLNGTG